MEEKIVGIESKRKDSTIYLKGFQTELLEKLMNKESKENIIIWIKNEIKELRNKSLQNISFPSKLSNKDYKNIPIFKRALDNTDGFDKKTGSLFYWLYIKPIKEQKVETHIYIDGEIYEILKKDVAKKDIILSYAEQKIDKKRIKVLHIKEKPINVQAFDEENFNHIDRNNIDWDLMIKRNITNKVDVIFEAMGWDIKEINPNYSKPNKETKNEVAEYIKNLKKENQIGSAEEVSKEKRLSSTKKSEVKVLASAPILNEAYEKIQIEKEKIQILKDFDLKDLEIKELTFQEAKKYISKNHYSHTISSSVKVSIGFYYKNELVTAIVYGTPIGRAVSQMLKVSLGNLLELVRVFSKDGLPKNTESYCLGQSFKILKEKYPKFKYLISYADAQHGHVGYIYQATNWRYKGEQSRTNFGIFLDEKEIHPRTCNAKFGTSSKKKLKEKFGNRIEFRNYLKKHVYLMCLGNRKERKEWYKKFEEKPYPKINKEV